MRAFLFVVVFVPCLLFAQISQQNDSVHFNDPIEIIMNNKMVEKYFEEYLILLESNEVKGIQKLNTLKYILIEPNESKDLYQEEGTLGKVLKEKHFILLSRICLIDSAILKVTLFRELSHFLGVPYEQDGVGIMSLNKPEGYSYGWIHSESAEEIIEFEYGHLIEQLKKYLE